MAIHYVSVECPNCGAELSVEDGRKQLRCSYCGKKLRIVDDNEYTIRIIDYAEIKRANNERRTKTRELELKERKLDFKERVHDEERAEKLVQSLMPYFRPIITFGTIGIVCYFLALHGGIVEQLIAFVIGSISIVFGFIFGVFRLIGAIFSAFFGGRR